MRPSQDDEGDGNPKDQLPLRPIETLILTMLTGGDRHGYGLRQDILDHTGGEIELEAGNLYRHIRRLEAAGALTQAPTRPATGDDERRVYYRLTPAGRRLLAAEMRRLRALVRLAERRRIIAPSQS